jgi:tetratricopeptide (TPR) repeat protein
MADALQEAIALHQKSDWHAAEAAYRRVLAVDPKNADALALLGTVMSELKQHGEAIKAIRAAVALDAQAPLFHFHLGNAFDKAGRHAEAEASFAIATAIAPNWTQAWYNLGNAQRAQNKNAAATGSYERVLKLDPTHALAHNNMAMSLLKNGDAAGARKRMEEGLKHQPDNTTLLLNFSEIAFEQNDLPAAFAAARKLAEAKLGIAPGDLSYLSRPGFFRNRDEESYNALLTLATSTLLQGKFAEASAILRGILAEEPDMEEVFLSLGTLALARNHLDEAEECYSQSFMLDPSNVAAPWNRSMVQLTKGNMREGFARYRWRWAALDKHKSIRLPRPAWDGSELKGKTLLIHEEQGFGDSLQMLRFIPQLKAMGAKVYFYAQAPLHPLLEGWNMLDRVSVWNLKDKTLLPEVDYVCGVMDLPGLMGTHAGNIPSRTPYLPNPRKDDPAHKLGGSKKKIGLVWAGNPLHKRDHERSVPLELFEPLIKNRASFPRRRESSKSRDSGDMTLDPRFRGDEGGMDFFSLQYKPSEKDHALLKEWGVTDLSPRIKNLADMAAYLAQLDLLITIDSAPAHLAGGLGVPTFLLVTHNPDWRWLLGREDSPWYPRLTLFRQPNPGQWDAAMTSIYNALRNKIELPSRRI